MDKPKTFLTTGEAAELLGVSRVHVWRLVKAGDINGVRVGKHYRIRTDEVDRYIELNSTGSAIESHELKPSGS